MDSGGVTLTGVPPEWEPLLTLLVAWASAWLVQPLTAIAKKVGCTQGPTTVAVSAGLSLLVAAGFSVAAAQASGQTVALGQVLLSAVLAFVRANGAYLGQVQAGEERGTGEGRAPSSTPG
ncbi:hypothetical protein ACFP81_10775 [Deinococcus lacus]|uniref:Holin n=1 Tax=Deinococcus lacus TaxID=392561 RepID=A0ABW1YDL2_9DEIO